MREASRDRVLPGHEVAGRELGRERERVAALPTETVGASRRFTAPPADGLVARVQKRRSSGTLGSASTAVAGSHAGHRRDLHEPGTEAPARHLSASRRPRRGGAAVRRDRCCAAGRRSRLAAGGYPALVAVAVVRSRPAANTRRRHFIGRSPAPERPDAANPDSPERGRRHQPDPSARCRARRARR